MIAMRRFGADDPIARQLVAAHFALRAAAHLTDPADVEATLAFIDGARYALRQIALTWLGEREGGVQ